MVAVAISSYYVSDIFSTEVDHFTGLCICAMALTLKLKNRITNIRFINYKFIGLKLIYKKKGYKGE